MMFESLVSGLYEFVCRITRNDSLPTVNAEMTLYALEFVVLFGVLFYVFGVGALCFWLSLAIVLVFNGYFMYYKGLKRKVRKKLKID